jgi:hypothetical protein
MSKLFDWSELLDFEALPEEPRRQTPKCDLCGRFTKNVTLVWTGYPEPEPDYEVGDCCKEKRNVRT